MVFKDVNGCVTIKLDTSRLDKNFKEAQKKLNELVVSDSTPYVPFRQGQLRSQVRYPEGIYGNKVEWYAPYAHYQYHGTVFTDENGRTFVGRGEVKTVDTGRPLTYKESGTQDYWFEEAKRVHSKEWTKKIKDICGRD